MSFNLTIRKPWQRYLVAVLVVAAAAAARMEFLGDLGHRLPFLTFFPAVLIVSLFCGVASGLLAAFLSAACVLYSLGSADQILIVRDASDRLVVAIVLISCVVVYSTVSALRRAQRRAVEAELTRSHESLELRVAQRTAEIVRANERLALLNLELHNEMKERTHVEQDLKASRDRLASLTSELNLSEERERRRIVTALHDGVVQDLALGKLKLSMKRQGETAISPAELSWLASLIGKAIEDIRDISFELSPPPLYDLGLPQAIDSLGERLARDHGFKFSLQDKLAAMFLPMDVRTVVYQTARELLVNVVKHARAKHVTVQIRHKLGMVQLIVIDDGVGFDPGIRKGFGLSHIAQRTEYMNGTLEIISKPGRKTVIAVAMPMNK